MNTFNPLTDFKLAHDADEKEISATFRELPWLVNLHANGQRITRAEWRKQLAEKQQKNGKL